MAAEILRWTISGNPVNEDCDWLCETCGLFFDPSETPEHLENLCKILTSFLHYIKTNFAVHAVFVA